MIQDIKLKLQELNLNQLREIKRELIRLEFIKNSMKFIKKESV